MIKIISRRKVFIVALALFLVFEKQRAAALDPSLPTALTALMMDEGVYARWGFILENIDIRPPEQQKRLLGMVYKLEGDMWRKIQKLRSLVPAAPDPDLWRRYLHPNGMITPEGLALLEEQGPTDVAPQAFSDRLSSIKDAAAAKPGRVLFDGDTAHDGATDSKGFAFAAPAAVAAAGSSGQGVHSALHPLLAEPDSDNGLDTTDRFGGVALPFKDAERRLEDSWLQGSGADLRKIEEKLKSKKSVKEWGDNIPIPDSSWAISPDLREAVSDKNPSAVEKIEFWNRVKSNSFYSGILNTVCKQVKLSVSQSVSSKALKAAGVSLTLGASRELRDPSPEELAIRDEVRLGIGASPPLPEIVDGVQGAIGFGAELRGLSRVTRPLSGSKRCLELAELIKLHKFKTVLPLKAERISAMQVGEIWQLPVRLRAWIAPTATYGIGPVAASVSLGYARDDGVSVGLKRLSQNELGFRMRIDHADVFSAGGQLVGRLWGNEMDQYRLTTQNEVNGGVGKTAGKFSYKFGDRLLVAPLVRYA